VHIPCCVRRRFHANGANAIFAVFANKVMRMRIVGWITRHTWHHEYGWQAIQMFYLLINTNIKQSDYYMFTQYDKIKYRCIQSFLQKALPTDFHREKSNVHVRFQLLPNSSTLDDLGRPIRTLLQKRTDLTAHHKIWIKMDPYYHQQSCIGQGRTLVFGNTRYKLTWIFAG